MIYIISGASRSGKTIIAKKLFNILKIPYLSTDHIMMGLMNGMPSSGINDKMWPHEIGEKLWPILNAMIENMIYNNQSYIFEGEAFIPKYIKELSNKFPGEIKVCFIGYSKIATNEKLFFIMKYPNHENDWLLNLEENEIEDHINNMKWYSQKLEKECHECNIEYYDLSSGFEKEMAKIIGNLVNEKIA